MRQGKKCHVDIAVKQEEAFEDGLIEGAKKNAFENANFTSQY